MNTETHDLLVELGTEELPPKQLNQLAQAFAQAINEQLAEHHLTAGSELHFASPRRLAVILHDLPIKQPDQTISRKGPALMAAYDSKGQPTPAALGFARACNCPLEALATEKTTKGEWLSYQKTQAGQPTKALLGNIINTAITQLPIARPMRWGSADIEFVRPLHWVVLLFGNQLIETHILGIKTGTETYGHRFHHPEPLPLGLPDDYESLLQQEAYVIADFNQRKTLIRSQVENLSAQKGHVVIEPTLLDEVTGLVEWPVALMADFDPKFLKVPAEALISAMQYHQKCFPIVDLEGLLLPHFITVSNIESKHPQHVIHGNEKVMHARLADAAFFYQQDLKTALIQHLERLKPIVFHHQLGSLYDKTMRLTQLSKTMATTLNLDTDLAEKIATLAKTDLVTHMVGEFPELQGIMGYYYARADQTIPASSRDKIGCALKEQYRPNAAGDAVPETQYGALLAIADRMDTLVGLFGVNCPPTGEKDPFGLRRAARGILRIIIEKALPFDLMTLIHASCASYQDRIHNANTTQAAFDFIMERLKHYYLDQDIKANVFAAVKAVNPTAPLDFDKRLKAVCEFEHLAQAEHLAAANKRVSNIIKKLPANAVISDNIACDLLTEPAEKELAQLIASKQDEVKQHYTQGNYTQALTTLATLQQPVDQFFDDVLVMTDDKKLQQNRLALLKQLQQLFLYVADISYL